MVSELSGLAVARRPRAFVRVSGADAADYLDRMVSNEVAAIPIGDASDALLLTPKARVIAPLRIWRRGEQDFLLLTEPELGERVRAELLRMRFAAKCEVELEEHASVLVFGGEDGIPNEDYGAPAREVLDEELEPTLDERELERMRIEAGTPRFGAEIDDRVLPAEAGLTKRAISFTKGCYPGQEPIARLHHRGHVNRSLRRLALDGGAVPAPETELSYEGKPVGRITSAVPGLALAYVRTEVPADATLSLSSGGVARPLP